MSIKSILTDEELLLAARMGDYKAETILAERYLSNRDGNLRFIAMEASQMLDSWGRNEAYFRAFINSVRGFRFLRNKLSTYFFATLKNEVIHLATKRARELALKGGEVSLDTPVLFEEEVTCSLSDVVPTGDFLDDPRAFFDYAEQLEEFHRLPQNADPAMLDVVRLALANYTMAETAKICCLTINKVKYLLRAYRAWATRSRRLITQHRNRKKPN